VIRLASVNVNGVRAAMRRGMGPWLLERRPDLLALQEVRASDEILYDTLNQGADPGWEWTGVHAEASGKGRAGVAVLGSAKPVATRDSLPDNGFGEQDGLGRWVEADYAVTGPGGAADLRTLTVISAYVFTGEAGTSRQPQKETFLAGMRTRLDELAAGGALVVLTGDLNVAHREEDLKNWKGNLGKAGFLPSERAWFDELFAAGWVDVVRRAAGDVPGPYSWWSWRGQAFDNDTGWRIDYQLTSPALAALVLATATDRAPSYAERWSDHAPVVVDYDLTLT